MFVDTSVIVAILADEADAGRFAVKLAEAGHCYTSGLVILEAAMRLTSLLRVDPLDAEARIQKVLEEAEISIVAIDGSIAKRAVAAFAAYGKGRGHPAQLNLADCLSYACAQAYSVPLLFKGNDFSQTDVQVA
ncbi:MAG TPA: type II toxin-antitoxin system VapC family toxin [Nitrobacter sp.]|jgi:ribonuclease VapC|nr:type II toxin-antitoxin system VapC family toxin [Nitrobacter sp.]